MIEFVRELFKKKEEEFKRDMHSMVSAYNQERETSKGYNGRQILELLQNCDDEGAETVKITLNKEDSTISIENDGTPFSERGYRSLFYSNLSSKTSKKRYIGNKGLGFRSIITWSNKIEIHSNGVLITYSEENKKRNFEKVVPDLNKREEILSEYDYSSSAYPIPFLTLPEIVKKDQGGYSTNIRITYKSEFFDDIIEQLSQITEKTLLFLNHIEGIEFNGIDIEDIQCERKYLNKTNDSVSPNCIIKTESSSWNIFSHEEDLPLEYSDTDRKEKEFYQIKIAQEQDFSDTDETLYSFFPTNIILDQPYILHATFDLDSTRNQLIDSPKNKFILKQVVFFTLEVAKYFASKTIDYTPLKILAHTHTSDSLTKLGYYEMIDEVLETEAVYPSINNQYLTKSEALFIDNSFAEVLIEAGGTQELYKHLKPDEEDLLEDLEIEINSDLSDIDDIIDKLNAISEKDLNINTRAKLIRQIADNGRSITNYHKNELNILLNVKGELVNGDDFIYTPVTKGEELKVPSFTNIEFMHTKLFSALVKEYSETASDNVSRIIASNLDGLCDLRSYEPAIVASKIVSEAKRVVKDNPSNQHEIVCEMMECLFSIYKKFKPSRTVFDSVSIPCLSESGKLFSCNELVLGSSYPSGALTYSIFGDIYSNDVYVAEPSELGITDPSLHETEEFLLWLGVNKFARYEKKSNVKYGYEYFDYVCAKSNVTNYTSQSYNVTVIQQFDDIFEQIKIEKLLFWMYCDDQLRDLIDDKSNDDEVSYNYYQRHIFNSHSSYIKYLLNVHSQYNFSDYLIDDTLLWANPFEINYQDELFINNEVTKTEINQLLIKLGAKDEFSKLPIGRVCDIINLLPKKYSNGAKSQTIYKKALIHYRTNGIKLNKKVTLFANDGSGQLKAFKPEEVFFSDKVKVPKVLYKDFPIFNFPPRAGGTEAIEFYQINDLKDIDISIDSYNVNNKVSQEFADRFSHLKPFLLCGRNNGVDDESTKKTNARICKELVIELCTNIQYSVGDKEYHPTIYEFVPQNDSCFLLRIEPNDTVESLFRNSVFIDSLASILSIIFDVSGDRNTFKYMLRSSYRDLELSSINDYGIELLNESKALLGMVDEKVDFWNAVFKSKAITYEGEFDDYSLETHLLDTFDYSFTVNSINYRGSSDLEELPKIKQLFHALRIHLVEFNPESSYPINAEKLHIFNLTTAIEQLKLKLSLKASIWGFLSSQDIDSKKDFLNILNRIDNYQDFVLRVAVEHKNTFEIDLDHYAKSFIESIIPKIQFNIQKDVEKIRKRVEEHFTDDELLKFSDSSKMASLLYFPDEIEFLKKQFEEKKPVSGGKDQESIPEKINVTLQDTSKLIPKVSGEMNNGKRKKPTYNSPHSANRAKKKKGDDAEEIVYNYLINYGFKSVQWTTKQNPSLHFDIQYLNESGEVKFVEVKSFDNNSFIISKAEFNFGKDNKTNWELWLVKNKEDLFVIDDFFTNDKYIDICIPYEYEVEFEITGEPKYAI